MYIDRRFIQTQVPYATDDLETMSEARRYQAHVFNLFRPYIGSRVLEVGSGIGTTTRTLLDIAPGRPASRGAAVHEPDRAARMVVQLARDEIHRTQLAADRTVRDARRALGAAARTNRADADRPLSRRGRPAVCRRMTELASSRRRTPSVPQNPLLSVVMPVYNERATIEEMIRRVLSVKLRIELIVVDDASKDGTSDILQSLQQELGFRLLRQPRNAGKGAALRRGFEAVTGDIVAIHDADL